MAASSSRAKKVAAPEIPDRPGLVLTALNTPNKLYRAYNTHCELLGVDPFVAERLCNDALVNALIDSMDVQAFKRLLDLEPTAAQKKEFYDCMQDTPLWHKARGTRATGSAFGTIVGVNPYQTYEKWKMEQLYPELRPPTNFHMLRGKRYEDTARKAFLDSERLLENKYTHCEAVGFKIHDKYFWLGGSPDGILHRKDGARALLEIKCPVRFYPTIPLQYYAQIQGLLEIFDLPYCEFVQFIAPNGPVKSETVKRNRKYIEHFLLPHLNYRFLHDFWPLYVQPRVPLHTNLADPDFQ